MCNNSIHFLIKIGKKEHIENLRNHGLIFMNSINYFKTMEADEQRKDPQEGIEKIEQISLLRIELDGKEISLRRDSEKNKLLTAQLRIANPTLEGNIFSMIAITPEILEETDQLDNKNMEFGDSFIVINNPKDFLNRVESAIKGLHKTINYGIVKYYDEKIHSGELDVFHKPMKFRHQNEFRIFIPNKKNSPLTLEIGTIESISQIFDISEFKKLRIKST